MNRIWIYQADRCLTDEEVTRLEARLAEFADRWTAHSKKLKASYELRHNRFVILRVENGFSEASGCSIDDSVRFLKELEKDFNLSLFDRSKMAYVENNEVKACSLNEIASLYAEHVLTDDTIVFDNTITTDDELASEWKKPLKESGYYNFLR
jgi:hypothetical protein